VFRIVLRREIQHNLYSLRFLISLALVIVVFAAGAVSFARSQAAALERHREVQTTFLDTTRELAGQSASELGVRRQP
jgi:hypothetical protein